MHYFKWSGLLLLFCIAFACAYWLAAFESRRFKQAEGFLLLLRHVRMQIDCFSRPMPQILSDIDPRTRALCAAPEKAADFDELLQGTRLLLDAEMCTVLFEFCDNLGKSYKEEQLRCCDYYIARLSPLCEKMREELPRRIRLAWMLPPAMAGTLLLLLL